MTPTGVLQAKSGIGDVMWHLPFTRAIAAASPGGRVTFLAPPTSHAGELLVAEPSVAETLYFEHSGSELRRGINLIRLIALLRRCQFRTLWILDRTIRPALAGLAAGIPERIGLGLTGQRWYITNGGVDQSHFHDPPIESLIALMAAMRVPLPSTEPALRLPQDAVEKIGAKWDGCVRPWIVLALSGSHPDKSWPHPHWVEFITALRRRTSGTVFFIGGAKDDAQAHDLITRSDGSCAINACDLPLIEAAALLHHSDLFIGPDSAPLNLAAATAAEAFGLFGSTPVLTYSKFIHAIAPDGGPSPGGMRKITPAQVLDRVCSRLTQA